MANFIHFHYSEQGGLPFVITLTEKLPEDDTSETYLADFVGVGVVCLEKFDSFTLTGSTPCKFFL